MKKFIPLIISLACAANVYALDAEATYVNRIANAINYVNQNPGKIWPEFVINTPQMIHFMNSHHGYAFNFSPINPSWKKSIVDNLPVYALDKDEYGLEQICDSSEGCWAGSQMTIDNQDVHYEIFPNNKIEDQDIPALVVVRDSFDNYFQPIYRLFNHDLRLPYDGYNNVMNVKLAYLERNVLASYLNGEQSENVLMDAIAIHQYRSKFLSSVSSSYESAMQAISGASSYVMFKSLNIQDKALVNKFYDNSCTSDFLGHVDFFVDMLHACTWFYQPNFFGAAYGYALDHTNLSGSWKTQLIKQGKAPESLLQDYYHLTEKDVQNRTMNTMQNAQYGFDKIDHDVDALLKPYLNNMAIQQDKYNKLDGIELLHPFSLGIYLAEEEYEINTRQTLLVNASGGESFDYDGASYRVKYDHIPFIYRDKVKLSSDTKMVIDGREDTIGNFLKNGESIKFTNLLIKNAQFSLEIKNVLSKLNVVDGKIQVEYAINSPAIVSDDKKYMSDLRKQLSKLHFKNKSMNVLLR